MGMESFNPIGSRKKGLKMEPRFFVRLVDTTRKKRDKKYLLYFYLKDKGNIIIT